jgi:hypothetical protein
MLRLFTVVRIGPCMLCRRKEEVGHSSARRGKRKRFHVVATPQAMEQWMSLTKGGRVWQCHFVRWRRRGGMRGGKASEAGTGTGSAVVREEGYTARGREWRLVVRT